MSAFAMKTEVDRTEYVQCRECGFQAHSLLGHLRDEHSMTVEEYQAKHADAPVLSPFGKAVYEEEFMSKSAAVATTPEIEVEETEIDSIESFNTGFGKSSDKPKAIRGYKGYEVTGDVPATDPHYVFQNKNSETRDFLMGMMAGGLVYLHGPTGSGKTTLPEQFAARTGRPFFRQQFFEEMEPSEITGVWSVVDGGKMVYLESGFVKAMQQPSVLVLDEFDSGNPTVSAIAQAVLEGKPLVLANNGGKRIFKHPDCLIVATGNTNGMGDDTGLYTSTSVQSFATMNRFQMFIPINYLPAEDEVQILKNIYGDSGLPETFMKDMVKVANLIRDGFTANKLTVVMSTRQVITWGKWLRMTGDEKRSYELAFANQLGAVDREVSDGLFQRVFGK